MMYLTASLPLAFVGPGAYSLDGRLGLIGRFDPATAWMVIGAAVAPGGGERRHAAGGARSTPDSRMTHLGRMA